MESEILSFIIFLPAVVAFILMVTTNDVNSVRNISFVTTLIIFGLVLKIYIGFEPVSAMQYVVNYPWIERYGINYYIGVDGFSLTILMLIAILLPTMYILLWKGRTKGYWINLLLVQTGVTGALLSLDVILFYFFWEMMLLPVFLMIGMFGTGDKIYTTIKVTVYTMAGSLFMFIAIMYLGVTFFNEFGYWSFQYNDFTRITTLEYTEQVWLFMAFMIAVSIKIPLFPFHTWIMATYKNAPTGAVFLLSSIMAKLGIYAIVRFLIPIFPDVYVGISQYFVALGLFGMVYFGIAALMQRNIKRMFAYASASHLNLIAAGVFSMNEYGINGALYLMIAHAISTGGLFLLVGIINFETKTVIEDKNNLGEVITKFRNIDDLGGLAKSSPIFTFIFAILLFANIGLPGTNGFVSELLIIFGIYKFNVVLGFITATSVVIGASYMLWMFQRAILQENKKVNLKMRDLNIMETISFIPWIVLIFLMGLVPNIFIEKFEPTVLHFIYDILKIGGAS